MSDAATAKDEARALLRAARSATLATEAEGWPHAALVTPATTVGGEILLLLSGLSVHGRHLRRNGRCAVLIVGEATAPNPQTAPRLAAEAEAVPDPDPAMRARWLARHPYAALYAELADFTIWRLRPRSFRYVGGFGRAHRFPAADLLPPAEAVAAITAAETAVLRDQPHGLGDRIAQAEGWQGTGWRPVALDTDGVDIARDQEAVRRLAFPGPVVSAAALRRQLAAMAG